MIAPLTRGQGFLIEEKRKESDVKKYEREHGFTLDLPIILLTNTTDYPSCIPFKYLLFSANTEAVTHSVSYTGVISWHFFLANRRLLGAETASCPSGNTK